MVLILPMPLEAFQPLKPAPGGPATVFPYSRTDRKFSCLILIAAEKLSACRLSTVGVLRLRATSAVSRDRSVKRFAQDDGFAGVLTKNVPIRLTLMGLRPG